MLKDSSHSGTIGSLVDTSTPEAMASEVGARTGSDLNVHGCVLVDPWAMLVAVRLRRP